MTKLAGTLALIGTLALPPAGARAQQEDDWAGSTEPDAGMAAEAAPPPTPPPSELPPALSSESPPSPPAQAEQASPPPGQWVYTQQYGWIWMPYSDRYTYAPPGGYGEPHVYVYYPAYGWTWLAAPWVWGVGPWPFFGVMGPARFAWYVHGWWRYPARWRYAPVRGGHFGMRPAPAFRHGAGFGGVRPAPPPRAVQGGVAPRPSPFRGGSAFMGGRGAGFASHAGPVGRGGLGWTGVRPVAHGGGLGFGGRGGGGHGGHGR
ncbi:MAG TPA: hypothetical protein VIW03_05555 [Anaeromyxobacter sp.]